MTLFKFFDVLQWKILHVSHLMPENNNYNFIFFRAITFLNHTMPDFTDNGASNIIKYGDEYFATSETNYIRKIDPVTLETQDKVFLQGPLYCEDGSNWNTVHRAYSFIVLFFTQVDYLKYLPVNVASSHPHYDKEGNAYNIGTSIAEKGKTKYILFKVSAVSAKGRLWNLHLPTAETSRVIFLHWDLVLFHINFPI